jgi:hypothetical protein
VYPQVRDSFGRSRESAPSRIRTCAHGSGDHALQRDGTGCDLRKDRTATWTDALDDIIRAEARKPACSRSGFSYSDSDFVSKDRTSDLAEWHALLLERLAGSEAEDRLNRLVGHPALGGPELTFLRARLAELRGDVGTAHDLAQECLQRLPGHQGFAVLAVRVGAELPASARDKLAERARLETATTSM